jgi:hypothetical protein
VSAIRVFQAAFPLAAVDVLRKSREILLSIVDENDTKPVWRTSTPADPRDYLVRFSARQPSGRTPGVVTFDFARPDELWLILAVNTFGAASSSLTLLVEVLASPEPEKGLDMIDMRMSAEATKAMVALGRAFPDVRWYSIEAVWRDYEVPYPERVKAVLDTLRNLPPTMHDRQPPPYLLPATFFHDKLAAAGLREGLDRVREVIRIATELPQDLGGPLAAAALELARALPLESTRETYPRPYDILEAFEHPSFGRLLRADRSEAIIPPLSEIRRIMASSPGGPLAAFLPSDPQNLLREENILRERRAEAATLRKPYFAAIELEASLVLRARGLALVFPYLPASEQVGVLAEIVDALTGLKSNPVAKAIGLVEAARAANRIVGARTPGHGGYEIIRALAEIGDGLLTARIARFAASWADDYLGGEAMEIGRAGLAKLVSAIDGSSDLQLGVLTQVQLDYTGTLYARGTEWKRDLTTAADVARRVSDPMRRAQLLLAVARVEWSGDDPEVVPPNPVPLFDEAARLLDGLLASESEGERMAWFKSFRELHPGTLDANAPENVEIDSKRAASIALGISVLPKRDSQFERLQAIAIGEVNRWLAASLPDVWPSLSPIQFPGPLPVWKAALHRKILRDAKLAQSEKEKP